MGIMRTINQLTASIKDKSADPDWFLLRQRLEQTEDEFTSLNATLDKALDRIIQLENELITCQQVQRRWFNEATHLLLKLAEAEARLAQFKAATFNVTTQATLDHVVEKLTI